jgi:hypothetical protein
VRGKFGGDRLREREVAGLAAFWQGEDEPSAYQLDLADNVQGEVFGLAVDDVGFLGRTLS